MVRGAYNARMSVALVVECLDLLLFGELSDVICFNRRRFHI